MLQVPSLGEYQSILNTAVLSLCKIGCCRLIKGSYTNLTVVYTVTKHAQMLSDILEQNDAVITSEVAFFIQAREIQLKFSLDF